jgi:hypothetical protein
MRQGDSTLGTTDSDQPLTAAPPRQRQEDHDADVSSEEEDDEPMTRKSVDSCKEHR